MSGHQIELPSFQKQNVDPKRKTATVGLANGREVKALFFTLTSLFSLSYFSIRI
jgi:hypothetical protein